LGMHDSGNEPERLQKVMARLGIASRRYAEDLISRGLVKVNGRIVKERGVKVVSTDLIEVEGIQISATEKVQNIYILLNKPEGVITSVADPRKRKTVIDILNKDVKERIYPVGRLDYDTTGVLLLTNDGNLTYRLTHPSYEVEKTYRVWIKGRITAEALETLRKGILLEDGLTSPAKIDRVEFLKKKGNLLTIVEITIHEGKNRQVRRMFEKIGYPVVSLQRIAFGTIKLDGRLKPGEYRFLSKSEVASLKKVVGLDTDY
jgi:23S rRNA pseudouridine2605 synthase